MQIAGPLGDHLTVGPTTTNLAWVKGLAADIDGGRRRMEPIVRSIDDAGHEVEFPPWFALFPGKLSLCVGDLDGVVEWLGRAVRFAEPMSDNLITVRGIAQ